MIATTAGAYQRALTVNKKVKKRLIINDPVTVISKRTQKNPAGLHTAG
jgi:hypothetical protein